MASPDLRSRVETNGSTATATPVVTLPATISAGDTICVVIRVAIGTSAIGWPGGAGVWNVLLDDASDASDDRTGCAWKKAVGGEGGTTITLSSTSAKFSACAWAVMGAEDPTVQPPQLTFVAGTSANPDPPTISPTGGSKDYLFLAVATMEGEQTQPPSGFPTNYINSLFANSGTGGIVSTNTRVFGYSRQATTATEDPSAYTVSASDDWTALTIAFHPSTGAPADTYLVSRALSRGHAARLRR